ncbi:protein kinase [Micromonospora echinaurantiaca]|uniref:protein kinase domain-containing protein n=1 Tax=Micromonospora echinaurantiaca TaxID=47857 RepID=UPI003718A2DF
MLTQGVVLSERYRLGERVATGGMGAVWRCTDLLLEREVAVKVLLPALTADPEFTTRFRAEARMLAALRHPGVVAVHDVGRATLADGSEVDYLVMEYVAGEPLGTWIRRAGRLDAASTMSVVAQAAEALHAAHQAGIVHRDVKPGNLLVKPDGRVVLVDFGIARSGSTAGITAAHTMLGTATYMSPEQATGQPVSPVTDVYALGAVAYFCLAGRPPFEGENPLQVALRHQQDEPAPLPPGTPPAVVALVERAMAKRPGDRYPSAAALAEAAAETRDATLASIPVSARPPWAVAGPSPTVTPPLAVEPVSGAGPAAPTPPPAADRSGSFGGTSASGPAPATPAPAGQLPPARPAGPSGPPTGSAAAPVSPPGPVPPPPAGPTTAPVWPFGPAAAPVSPSGPAAAPVSPSGPAAAPVSPSGSHPAPVSPPSGPPSGFAAGGFAAGGFAPGRAPAGSPGPAPGQPGADAWGLPPTREDPVEPRPGRRRIALVGAAAAVLLLVVGVVAATTLFAGDPGDGDRPAALTGGSADPMTGEPAPAPTDGNGRLGTEPTPGGSASATPAPSGAPGRSTAPPPGGPAPTGGASTQPSATPSTSRPEKPNPYTPAQACGSGYQVIDSASLTVSGVRKGRVYLLYHAGTGYNCVVTMKDTAVGTKTAASAYLEVRGRARSTDSGSFAYYAGPVKAKAAGVCVKWGGSTGGASYGSGFEHCG